ncbi:wsc domain-containing protein [Phaffia rhodozyma]|uniref:Wsc domain-containing protein n=1 Tax=Phaffia rhodozyma TaxID=264483 RepID=A0A0F7SIH9_PHARH|nr:wsc domain-containing protein [Phaffia rhodozyma]
MANNRPSSADNEVVFDQSTEDEWDSNSVVDPERGHERSPGEGYPTQDGPLGSQYRLSRPEVIKGFANRIVHSRSYIILYLGMAALSITTVVLSLQSECPPISFYILEVVVNLVMILEVGIRLVAFGRQFYQSIFNLLDLLITLFCIITLLVVFWTPCSSREEVLDDVILVVRNVFQFGRLAVLMRRSGTSLLTNPTPIDLSSARQAAYALDLDLEDEEAGRLITGARAGSVGGDGAGYVPVQAEPPRRGVGPVGGDRGRDGLTEDDEDMWDRLS